MPRVQLEMPEKYTYSIEVPLRISDLNYGKHVGNDTVLTLVQEARVQYIRKIGYEDELNIDGLGMIMSDAALVYKAEMTYGMKVKIEIGVKDFNKYGFDIYYRLTDQLSMKELAHVKTGIVFFDYQKKRIAPAPFSFIIKMNL